MFDQMMQSEIEFRASRVREGVRGARRLRRRPVLRLGERVDRTDRPRS